MRQYFPTEFGIDPPNFKAYEKRFDLTKPVSYDKLARAGADELEGGVVVVRVTNLDAKASIEAIIGNRVSDWIPAGGALYEARFKPEKPISKALRSELNKSKKSGAEIVSVEGCNVLVRVKKAKSKKSVEQLLGDSRSNWTPRYPDPGLLGYTRSLSQDNYVCLSSGEEGTVWWFLDGDQWSERLCQALEQCLMRMTYFGRAEAFTRIAVETDPTKAPTPNCTLLEQRISGTVPVLVPESTATRKEIERVTDDPEGVKRSVPPGARFLYATRPPRPVARVARTPRGIYRETNLLQFAIGWNVPPEARAIVRLTAKMRGAALKEMLVIMTGDPGITWSQAPLPVREAVAEMAGKDAEGKPLKGHRHTEYLVWFEDGEPVRLVAWRNCRPFDENEQAALLKAAGRQFSWAVSGDHSDVWKVRLVPLDRAVPLPPGFDGATAAVWESVTPYVPPRHNLRGGKLRLRESIENQITRELSLRGFGEADQVTAEQLGAPEWVAVHLPRAARGKMAFIGDRLGFRLRLRFPTPVAGPIRLGHSSSFGLGLFRPIS